jgi:hypothetical protein
LDLLAPLTAPAVRESASAAFTISLGRAFHKYYDASPAVPSTLASLYSECVQILTVFGFPAPVDATEYCFGALRASVRAFHARCFPDCPAPPCVCPATVRQLRALSHFLTASLARLGFGSGEHPLQDFQRAQGLPEGPCGAATLRRVWTALLAGGDDPASLLAQVGVRLPPVRREGDAFGEISPADCGEAGKRVAVGLSRSISSVAAVAGTVARVQKAVTAAAQAGAGQGRVPAESAAALAQRTAAAAGAAAELRAGALRAAAHVEASLRVVDALAAVNEQLETKLCDLRQALGKEVGRTNVLVLAAVLLAALIAWAWMGRKAAGIR